MDPLQYLNALRRRWPAIVALMLLGALAAGAYAATRPVLYAATGSAFVASQGGRTTTELLQGSTYAQNQVQSYAELAELPVVLEPVIAELGLTESSEDLAERVSTEVELNTVIIDVTVLDPDPAQAARIADAVVSTLGDVVAGLTTPSEGAASALLSPVAEARIPSSPASPNTPFLVVTGLGLGVVLGLAYAFGRSLLDTRFAGEDEFRSTPGLVDVPFLGAVARRRGRVANTVRSDPHSPGAEEYRRIFTNLEFAGVDSAVRSATVTSALSGEGKSTTALNLATAIAERMERVLLVDADLRRPRVADYSGLDGSLGLTDVLVGAVSANQAIQRSGAVDVLPAGTLPPNVSQLIASEAMSKLFKELVRRYDFVLVDAPPLLPVVDALTLVKLTDGAVLVAQQRSTRRRQFLQAAAALRSVDARILGTVLNEVRGTSSSTGYGYAATNPDTTDASLHAVDIGRRSFFDPDPRPSRSRGKSAPRSTRPAGTTPSSSSAPRLDGARQG